MLAFRVYRSYFGSGFCLLKQLSFRRSAFYKGINTYSSRTGASLLSDQSIQQVLADFQTHKKGRLSNEEWLSTFRIVSKVDCLSIQDIRKSTAKLIRAFTSSKMYSEASSLMNYLDQHHNQLVSNSNLIGPFVRLCAETISNDPSEFKQRCAEINKWLCRIPLSSPYDLQTASDIITAIAVLPDWKAKSEFLLAGMRAGSQAYDSGQIARLRLPLISSAIKDHSVEEFNVLIRDMLTVATRSHSSAECNNIVSFVVLNAARAFETHCESPTSSQMLAILIRELESLTSNDYGSGFLVLTASAATALASAVVSTKLYNISKWTPSKDTFVDSNTGKCRSCYVSLPPLRVSDAVFNLIKSEFLKKALPLPQEDAVSKSNSPLYFLRSNPKELDYFHRFLEKNAPFDVIIDGLNVSHRHSVARRQNQPPSHRGRIVLKVATYYANAMKRRVLIVAKKHVERSWSPDVLKSLRKLEPSAKLFLSDNLSDDDALLLSAALASGPEALLISHDDFRQPAAILSNDNNSLPMRPSFRRWLASRHGIFLWWDEQMKTPVIRGPRQFVIGISRTSKIEGQHEEVTLHIPYESEETEQIRQQNVNNNEKRTGGTDFRLVPTSLLCLKGRRSLGKKAIAV